MNLGVKNNLDRKFRKIDMYEFNPNLYIDTSGISQALETAMMTVKYNLVHIRNKTLNLFLLLFHRVTVACLFFEISLKSYLRETFYRAMNTCKTNIIGNYL